MPRGAEAAQSNTQPISQIFRRPQIYIAQQSLATLAFETTCDTFSLMPELPNRRVALVTGAAKRLGRAVALRLAEEGCDVVIHYRSSESEARDVVSEVEKLGRRALAGSADLVQLGQIKSLFEQTAQHFGRLDILINSAANFFETPFAQVTEADWDRALDSNLKAPFFCAQAAAPLLKASRGVIINFADVGGILGWPEFIPHSISKAGVIMLTRTLAKELAPEVRVNAIAPGTITMPGDPPEWQQDFIKQAPLKRTGTPTDIADAVSFLVNAKFITGHVLVVDGGRVL
jgi:pteridine reductase